MKEAIIEKIKKLLRMKRGGTAGEIENALAAAARLAREHGINLDDVDPNAPEAQPIGHLDAVTAARLQQECKYAALVCQNFFNITVLVQQIHRRKYQILLIGTTSDRAVALYIYNFLVGHFRRSWNKRQNLRLRNRSAFMHGIFLGLCHKLHEARATEPVVGNALIRLDQQLVRRDEYLKNHFGKAEQKVISDGSDAHASKQAGYAAGRKTEIRPGVGHNSKTCPALPPAKPQLQLL